MLLETIKLFLFEFQAIRKFVELVRILFSLISKMKIAKISIILIPSAVTDPGFAEEGAPTQMWGHQPII